MARIVASVVFSAPSGKTYKQKSQISQRNELGGKDDLIAAMENFEQVHKNNLPNVDISFVVDLLLRLRRDPNTKPMYTVEVFVEPGTDTEEIRNTVIRETGSAPQFHDKGTHVVAHHKMDYDLLKVINDYPGVKEVVGTYMGSQASIGASHEPSSHAYRNE
jgi:hypothetical protein